MWGPSHSVWCILGKAEFGRVTTASVVWLFRMFSAPGYLPWQQMCLAGFSPSLVAAAEGLGWQTLACVCALLIVLRGHISWAAAENWAVTLQATAVLSPSSEAVQSKWESSGGRDGLRLALEFD